MRQDHAEAARDFMMAELATKADLMATRSDVLATEQRLQTSITEVQTGLRMTKQELENRIDTLSLRLTVRLGTIVVVGLGALAAILKLA